MEPDPEIQPVPFSFPYTLFTSVRSGLGILSHMERFQGYGLLGVCFFLGASLVFAAETPDLKQPPAKFSALKTDVVMIAVPIRARGIMAGGTINALEKPASEMPPVWTSVLFRVERVVEGEFKIPPSQEFSLWGQMKDAAGEKNILKLLTMDFEKPDDEGTDKGWLSMAVIDPESSFGIREGEAPSVRQRYQLSLARVHRDPDSYVLLGSKKL